MSFPPTNSRPEMMDPGELINSMLSQMMGMGDASSGERCMETDWRGHPAQPLFSAACRGDVDELKRVLEERPELRNHINDLDGDRSGILAGWALNGEGEDPKGIVNAIVDAGGDVNLRNGTQETPLLMATIYKRVEIVEALLERGARVDYADWSGKTPVSTAREYCEHDGKSDEKCCKVLNLLLEAEERLKEDTHLQNQATHLRDRGNKAFQKGQYEEARDLYTQSLEVLEDYRTFSNRSLCNLKIGKEILSQEQPGCYSYKIVRWGEEAMADAAKACTMEPTFAKAYYRMALGHAMARDFPRAKSDVKEGLEKCPDHEALTQLLEELNDFSIPDHFSNPFSDAAREANNQVAIGAPFSFCIFCRAKIPLSWEGRSCPFCSMDLDADIDEKVIISFIMNH